MRRKLMLAILVVTAVALVLTGLGTLVLVRRATLNEARSQLLQSATNLTAQLRDVPLDQQRATILLVQKAANLDDGQEIVLGPRGNIVRGQLPPGVSLADLDTPALVAGNRVSGTVERGRLAFAAVVRDLPVQSVGRQARPDVTVAIVLTRKVQGPQRGVPYFVLTAGIVLLVAAVVADRLSRRITRPLRDVEDATKRVAAGDLSVQVPVAPPDYPELTGLTQSINTMADSLSRSRNLERQFLMSVSHDLRTPLTSIRGFAEAISDGAATDVAGAAEVIAAESRRLERLVRDLLDLARLDARQFSLDIRRVDVGEVVADTANSFGPAAAAAGLSLNVSVASGLDAAVDPDRLGQVVANLVENAFKFASSRIEVTAGWSPAAAELGTHQHGTHVQVAITDDGPGIPPDDLPRVFERLYQSARTPARQAGSGLGLAIVAELVHAMGGTVRTESPVGIGGGTRMIVSLTPWSSSSTAPAPWSSSIPTAP